MDPDFISTWRISSKSAFGVHSIYFISFPSIVFPKKSQKEYINIFINLVILFTLVYIMHKSIKYDATKNCEDSSESQSANLANYVYL